IQGSNSVNISSSVFSNCWTDGDGGGLKLDQNRIVCLTNSLFDSNHSANGSLFSESKFTGDSLIISKSVFNSNTALVSGGGIALKGGIVKLIDVEIVKCQAAKEVEPLEPAGGGGIFALNTKLILESCKIYQNSSRNLGGGIYATALTDDISSVSVLSCYINNNYANRGGGFYFDNISADLVLTHVGCNMAGITGGGGFINLIKARRLTSLTNCLVYGNLSQVDDAGAGIHVRSLDVLNPGTPVLDLINTTFYNQNKYSIFCQDENNNENLVNILNTIIYRPEGPHSRNLSINDQRNQYYIESSDIQNIPVWAKDINGNRDLPPDFIPDYLLLNDKSPCIDAGKFGGELYDNQLPPGKGKYRNDMGATGGPYNSADLSFYKMDCLQASEPAFRVLDIDCAGVAKVEILSFRPDLFVYKFRVNTIPMKPVEGFQNMLPLKQGRYNKVKLESIAGSESSGYEAEVYAPGPLDGINPKIVNFNEPLIRDSGNCYLQCFSGSCTQEFVFDVDPISLPPLTTCDWIIEHPGNIEVFIKDDDHYRFDIKVNSFTGQESIRVGYRISNKCFEKVTWYSFKLEQRQGFASGIQTPAYEDIKISPNPFTENVIMSIDGTLIDSRSVTIEVRDGLGRILTSSDYQVFERSTHTLSLEHLPKGIYYLVVKSNSLRKSFKIVKI
ncbi:MAG: T9SS type A sorting domain-containing protein, partial [Bacteroidia bacterium]|nr:T9SS type A sorting domain-containing protein [Bacteroidia bacterium]